MSGSDIESPFPFLEWRFGESGLLEGIEELAQTEEPTMALVECAYHMGYFEEAAEAAGRLVKSSKELDRMYALCMQLYALIASDEVEAAEACLRDAIDACHDGLARTDDPIVHGMSVICLRLIEDATDLKLEAAGDSFGALENMPSGLQAHCGFQLAYRVYRNGECREAIGMARAFQAIAGRRYPVSCIKLHLLAASAYMCLHDPDKAADEFEKALAIAKPLDIVAPFVEMGPCMPGLIRHCLRGKDEGLYRTLRSMMARRHAGWYRLRKRCHQPVMGENLSMLEYSTCALVAWGWSNREIASFLNLAENTVKHYLTSSYQKLGVKNRREIADVFVKLAFKEEPRKALVAN